MRVGGDGWSFLRNAPTPHLDLAHHHNSRGWIFILRRPRPVILDYDASLSLRIPTQRPRLYIWRFAFYKSPVFFRLKIHDLFQYIVARVSPLHPLSSSFTIYGFIIINYYFNDVAAEEDKGRVQSWDERSKCQLIGNTTAAITLQLRSCLSLYVRRWNKLILTIIASAREGSINVIRSFVVHQEEALFFKARKSL